jgi:tetratricopeptide (TPR) repeat protein
VALGQQHPELAAQAEMALAGSLTSQCRPQEGIEHFDRAAELDSRRDARTTVFGFRSAVMALAWRAHALWLAGRSEEAGSSARAAVRVAEDLRHPYSETVAHAYAAITCQLQGDPEGVHAHATAAVGLCHTYGFGYYDDWAELLRGWAGGGDEGVDAIRRALARLEAAHAGARRPYYLGLLADVLIGLGRRRDAAETLAEALDAARRRDDRNWEPELLRLQATLAPAGRRRAELQSALELAQAQGSPALEARVRATLDVRQAGGERARNASQTP